MGTSFKRSTEAYILPYVKYIASGNLLYDLGCSNPVLCEWQPRGWDGVRHGKEVQEGGDIYIYIYIYTPIADACWYMTETNIVKQLSSY